MREWNDGWRTNKAARGEPGASPGPSVVFVQPLAACVRTDHRHALRIALAIQNLADHPLQLVSVDVIDRIPGLTLQHQVVGARPCADHPVQGSLNSH